MLPQKPGSLLNILLFSFLGTSTLFAQVPQPTPPYSESVSYEVRQFEGNKEKEDKKKGEKASERHATAPGTPPELTISVAVFDSTGPVTNLRPADLEVFVDGQPASIASITSNDEPVHIVLMVDVSPSAEGEGAVLKRIAVGLLNKLPATDQVMVVAFADKTRVLSQFGDDRKKAIAAIAKIGGMEGTSLYGAMGELLSTELLDPPPRTAVILMTDGVDTTSRKYNYHSSLRLAESSDLVFFPLYFNTVDTELRAITGLTNPALAGIIFGQPSRLSTKARTAQIKKDDELGRYYLTDLSLLSGGYPIQVQELDTKLSQLTDVSAEMKRRYYVRIATTFSGTAGERHTIRLRVNRPGLTILSKASYVEK
jgi:VWFA-related protein